MKRALRVFLVLGVLGPSVAWACSVELEMVATRFTHGGFYGPRGEVIMDVPDGGTAIQFIPADGGTPVAAVVRPLLGSIPGPAFSVSPSTPLQEGVFRIVSNGETDVGIMGVSTPPLPPPTGTLILKETLDRSPGYVCAAVPVPPVPQHVVGRHLFIQLNPSPDFPQPQGSDLAMDLWFLQDGEAAPTPVSDATVIPERPPLVERMALSGSTSTLRNEPIFGAGQTVHVAARLVNSDGTGGPVTTADFTFTQDRAGVGCAQSDVTPGLSSLVGLGALWRRRRR